MFGRERAFASTRIAAAPTKPDHRRDSGTGVTAISESAAAGERAAGRENEDIDSTVAAWRRRTENFAIAARLILSLLILTVYLLAPRPTDAGERGNATLIIILSYVGFALFRMTARAAKRFDRAATTASVPIDFLLLGCLIDSYQAVYGGGAALSLHSPSFAFYFVFIALHSMRLDWRTTLAAGASAMASWGGVVAAALLRSDAAEITHQYSEFALSGAILIGAEVERFIALAVMTAAASLTAHSADVLMRRLVEIGVRAEREKARAEADLLTRARDAAERASEMKSQFLAKMSHELRTPLNGVLGFADVLAGSLLDEAQRRHASMIRSSGESLLGLIDDILEVTTLQSNAFSLAREPFYPARLFAEIGEECRRKAAGKRLDCRIDIAADFPAQAIGDSARLRKAIAAVCDNAVKFTPAGEIDFRAHVERVAEKGIIAHVVVRDTGIGIAEADQRRIFEFFEQADNSGTRAFDGAGLGLAVSKRIIDAMGGRIDLRSLPGSGTSVRIDIPLTGPAS